MDNPFPQGLFNSILGVVMALLAGIAGLFHGRVKVLEQAHLRLLSSYVTKDELKEYLRDLGTQRKEMHEQNTGRLERIEDGLQLIHRRIDDIPYRSQGARTRKSDP